jgi:hypothetical protein
MAKFLSFDGVDAQNVRAEVMVQTGTGRIKELVGRGKPNENGAYRNMEVVFEPDNLLLKRKVYALLDTTAKDLWEYVQAAHADQRDIAYRIESQRKRSVDRSKKFDDLIHTEEVVRVLAAIDGVFSHEAKTNPKEDPTGENPSALHQDIAAAPAAGAASVAPADSKSLVAALAAARKAGLASTTVDTLVALALAAGASVEATLTAGYDNEGTKVPAAVVAGRMAASEEKPWMAYNSDGRVNAGSYMVAHAATAEQFALDHLISVYSEGKKTPVDVSDSMIAQAASIAFVLLEAADEVQVRATGGRADRQKNSYNRALGLVLDAVGKRYSVPVGGNSEAQATWREQVVAEAAERLYGVTEIAQGRIPKSEAERAEAAAAAPVVAAPAVAAAPAAAPVADEAKPAAKPSAKASKGEQVVANVFAGATVTVAPAFKAAQFPGAEEDGFVAPSDALVARLRELCTTAGVATNMTAISDWLERALGVRATRKVHGPALESFIDFYEKAGTDVVRAEVAGQAA